MQKYESLIIEKRKDIGIITLNKYENRNALTDILKKELIESIELFEQNEKIKSIILTGIKGAFCSGGDIKTLSKNTPLESSQSIQQGQNIILKILMCDKPIIVALNGIASGAGCSIVLAADVVIATQQAKLMFSFSNIGLIPDLGSMYLLPKAIGINKSKEIFSLGGELSADEAFVENIFNRLVDKEVLIKEAVQHAACLNNRNQRTIKEIKRIINQYWHNDLSKL